MAHTTLLEISSCGSVIIYFINGKHVHLSDFKLRDLLGKRRIPTHLKYTFLEFESHDNVVSTGFRYILSIHGAFFYQLGLPPPFSFSS